MASGVSTPPSKTTDRTDHVEMALGAEMTVIGAAVRVDHTATDRGALTSSVAVTVTDLTDHAAAARDAMVL